MKKLRQYAADIAARVGKADDMRISASQVACAARDYLRTDEGIAEAITEGLTAPTLQCFFEEMVVTSDHYPQGYASFRSFKRLLQIGGTPEVDEKLRARDAEYDRAERPPRQATVRERAGTRPVVLTEPDEFVGQPVEITKVWVDDEPPEGPAPNGIIRAWFDFPAAREEFLDHLRNNGYEIAKIRKGT